MLIQFRRTVLAPGHTHDLRMDNRSHIWRDNGAFDSPVSLFVNGVNDGVWALPISVSRKPTRKESRTYARKASGPLKWSLAWWSITTQSTEQRTKDQPEPSKMSTSNPTPTTDDGAQQQKHSGESAINFVGHTDDIEGYKVHSVRSVGKGVVTTACGLKLSVSMCKTFAETPAELTGMQICYDCVRAGPGGRQ